MANFTGSVQWARRRPWSGGRRPSHLGSPPWRRRRRWSAPCTCTAPAVSELTAGTGSGEPPDISASGGAARSKEEQVVEVAAASPERHARIAAA
jgi:hypothetical protein